MSERKGRLKRSSAKPSGGRRKPGTGSGKTDGASWSRFGVGFFFSRLLRRIERRRFSVFGFRLKTDEKKSQLILRTDHALGARLTSLHAEYITRLEIPARFTWTSGGCRERGEPRRAEHFGSFVFSRFLFFFFTRAFARSLT